MINTVKDQFTEEKIKQLLHKYKEILENYDKTREWLIGRARIDITLIKKQFLF